jgi:hypothetical protein
MTNKGKADPLVEPSDFVRRFAVTNEGQAKFPVVRRTESPNVVRLDEYRSRLIPRRRPSVYAKD